MISVLANRTYRHLFAAQVSALVGTGIMTVGLALLAFELAGDNAGAVLGTALAIKMIAYIGIAPIAGGFAARLPRRGLLITLDLIRASVAVALPFVDQVWQIYVLIALLQSASAAFTPTFQATIPDILTEEEDYTKALSLSRLAYDLENLLSPMLAAALISLIGFHWLFGSTVIGFLGSAVLILSVALPQSMRDDRQEKPLQRITRGIRIYFATPRLRALLALNLAVAAAGAMVIVNTVVFVKGLLGFSDAEVAFALAAFGGGSMAAALVLPHVLKITGDRSVMIGAATAMPILLVVFSAIVAAIGQRELWAILLIAWALLGFSYSATQVPIGRVLRRSAHGADRPAVFAAQFALSHACWLAAYPLAGWLGSATSMPVTMICLGSVAACGAITARRVWPIGDPNVVAHEHPELPADHPHLAGSDKHSEHAHPYIIDDLHPHWPVVNRQ